jgi:hypothetical protein
LAEDLVGGGRLELIRVDESDRVGALDISPKVCAAVHGVKNCIDREGVRRVPETELMHTVAKIEWHRVPEMNECE